MTAGRRVPTVLFLIADTGGGHRSAANAIRAAMHLIAPETPGEGRPIPPPVIDVNALPFAPQELIPANWHGSARPWHAEIHDIFQECGRLPLRRTVRLYGPTVEKTPTVYSGFYHVTNTAPAYAALSAITQRLLSQGLCERLEELRPDVIVSVHPLLTHPTLNIIRMMGMRVPFLTVVTDLVKFHRAWAEPEVDVCSVPTEAARDLVIELGMAPEKVRLIGMPIHPKFCLMPADRGQMRRDLGLDPDLLTVLLVGGGDGVGGIGEATLALAASQLPIQVIVVTGRNHQLYQELAARQDTLGVPAKILGFVENMPDLMHAADVIVTKAGPGTIMEALSCGLPIILSSAIPGQEVGNIAFVANHQVGVHAPTPEAIVHAVRDILVMSPAERDAIRNRALQLSDPRAPFEIARLIFSYLPSPRSISVWNQMPRSHVFYVPARRPRRRVQRVVRSRQTRIAANGSPLRRLFTRRRVRKR